MPDAEVHEEKPHVAVNVDSAVQQAHEEEAKAAKHNFGITPDEIYDLLDPKNPAKYAELGGIQGMLDKLKVDPTTGLRTQVHDGPGLSPDDAHLEDGMRKRPNANKRTSSILSGISGRGKATEEPKVDDPVDGHLRREAFGSNRMPEPVSKSLLAFMWDALKDKTLIVLMIAAAVEIAVGIYKAIKDDDTLGIIDGVAIIVAVMIVVLVASINDFRKQAQFRKLNAFSKSLSTVTVLRNGQVTKIPTPALLVGDIATLETGDVLPADGVLVQGFNLDADESSLTGEPIGIHKDLKDDPFLLSGTKIVNGMGKMLVIATGVNSLNGRSMLALEVEPEETPLQEKLSRLADEIAKFGVGAASLMVVALLIAYFATGGHNKGGSDIANDIIAIFITAVTLVVVAVPEGLPLAVTLALAHATIKMLADKNLVRHLSACETMGNATTICSDKTGTLTVNKMTVTSGVIADIQFTAPDLPDKFKSNFQDEHKRSVLEFISRGVNVNSTAGEQANRDGKVEMQGNKTEIAILNWASGIGYPYKVDRERTEVVDVQPFSSERKRMSTVIKIPHNAQMESTLGITDAPAPTDGNRYWMIVKGASEIVLKGCNAYIDANGKIQPLDSTARTHFESLISGYANQALRTIVAAFKPISHSGVAATEKPKKDTPQEDEFGLTLCAIFGIQDPVRPEVPDAVKSCQDAGIRVRMVTGDNVATARAIAKECAILTEGGVVMEGPVFRKLSEEEMDEVLPKLQVLARSSPLDKQVLVRALKRLGETVAVTGDGTNDAPALKGSDVGFSMGIAGTEVAKEASDIVILDDNFASIVKAVLWGRSVFDSVRKFLQFQLTVNVSAVVITIVSSLYTTIKDHKPASALTAVQLLWVNLIMDTLAALALATDPPTPDLLKRKPSRRNERLVNFHMARMIIGQGIYQIVACLVIYFVEGWEGEFTRGTMVFNAFVICQVFNEVNCRSITRDLNIFKNITRNHIFQSILLITIILQALITQFGGEVFKTNGLNGWQWGVCIAVGFGSIPVGILVRLLPDWRRVKDEEMDVREANAIEMREHSKEEAEELRMGIGRSTQALVAPEGEHPAKHTEAWNSAIRRTQMQLRVVNAFRPPTGDGTSTPPPPQRPAPPQRSDTSRSGEELWNRARDVRKTIGVVNAFRGGRRRNEGVVAVQMVDVAGVREGMFGNGRGRGDGASLRSERSVN